MKKMPVVVICIVIIVLNGFPFLFDIERSRDVPTNYLINSDLSSTDGCTLTWTSHWESIPQSITDNSTIIGDHIILNATFNEDILGMNITSTELRIIDGFTFNITRPLKTYSDGVTTFDFVYDELDWINITGISYGDLINITGYAENDCDYFAFDGTTPIQDYDWNNNLLGAQMATNDNPEHGEFIWNSLSDTMVFGCFNYDNTPEGNWSVYMEIGELSIHDVSGNSISLDTYWLDNNNDTYEITAIGYAESNYSFILKLENITLCNFFSQILFDINVSTFGDDSVNITWQCHDSNLDEVHYYNLWLSNDDGYSYVLLATNFTNSWFVWNYTGWLQQEYVVRIRAYSADLSLESPCTLDNPPESYWPGDMSELVSHSFEAGTTHTYIPSNIYVDDVEDILYVLDSEGNSIAFHISLTPFNPVSISYDVYDNSTLWFYGSFTANTSSFEFSLNFDGLDLGSHDIQIRFDNGFDYIYSEFRIIVYQSTTTTTTKQTTLNVPDIDNLFHFLLIGISVGSSVVIVAVVILTIRLRLRSSDK